VSALLAVSADGHRALVQGVSVASRELSEAPRLVTFPKLGRGVSTAVLTADGRWGATGDYEHDLFVWDLNRAMDPLPQPKPVPWHEATFEGFSISGELAVFKSAQGDPVIVDVGTGTIAHIAAVPEIWGARRTEQAEEGGLFTPRESATKISEATKIRKKPSKKTRSNDYPVDDFGRSRGHDATVTSVCMAQNGRWEVTASHDGTARLWDVANDRPLAMFSSELGLSSCQWSPDSRTLAVIDSANRTHLLRVEGG
jgi:WD40 repeat protein